MAFNTRPTPELDMPCYVFCYSFLRHDEIDLIKESKHTNSLVVSKQLSQCQYSSRLEVYKGNNIELRKEIHHEFLSYIWIVSGVEDTCNAERYLNDFPINWVASFPGKLLTKLEISFERTSDKLDPKEKINNIFGGNQLIGNLVEEGNARIWTDFNATPNIEELRVHIEDFSLGPRRRGRICQNIIELENYRSMAEIAFPIAEKIVFDLEEKEIELAQIIKEISVVSDTQSQQDLLHQLLDLSVKSENWRSHTGHRFSATFAYKKIFEDRLLNLGETKVLGYQSFSEFFNRNTMPTFRTCDAANDRLNLFISRIDRAVSLLSTRISSAIEQQNNALLNSADRQNRQQITLQETIEAFAIVAISYNSSALIKLLLDSLKAQGYSINIPFWMSISIPITLIGSFVLMRLFRNFNSK